MLYVVLGVLNEVRPTWFFILAAFLFVLSQLAYFLLSKVICQVTRFRVDPVFLTLTLSFFLQNVSHKLDGSFVATVLETAAVVVIYFGWRGITEGSSIMI